VERGAEHKRKIAPGTSETEREGWEGSSVRLDFKVKKREENRCWKKNLEFERDEKILK